MNTFVATTFRRLSLSIVLGLALTGQALAATAVVAERVDQSTAVARTIPDPAQQLMAQVRALQANDLQALLRTSLSEAQYNDARAKYELARSKPVSEQDRAEFAKTFEKLLAPNAETTLMQEIEPALAEKRPQLAGALLMGFGAMQMAVSQKDTDLSEAERASLQVLLPKIQLWASETDFLSADLMRKVIRIAINTARTSGVNDLDDLKALTFEQATARADQLLMAAKQSAAVYNLDLDRILSSVRIQTLNVTGNTAKIRTQVTVFDTELSHEQSLALNDGRWTPSTISDVAKVKIETGR